MEILVKVKRKCSQVAIHGLGVEEEEPKLIRKMCKIKEKSFRKCGQNEKSPSENVIFIV